MWGRVSFTAWRFRRWLKLTDWSGLGSVVDRYSWLLTVATAFIGVVTWASSTVHDWRAKEAADKATVARFHSEMQTRQLAIMALSLSDVLCNQAIKIRYGRHDASENPSLFGLDTQSIELIRQTVQELRTSTFIAPEDIVVRLRMALLDMAAERARLVRLDREDTGDDPAQSPDPLARVVVIQTLIGSFAGEEPSISIECPILIPATADEIEVHKHLARQALKVVLERSKEFNFAGAFQKLVPVSANDSDQELRSAKAFDEIVANLDQLDPRRGIDAAANRFFQIQTPKP